MPRLERILLDPGEPLAARIGKVDLVGLVGAGDIEAKLFTLLDGFSLSPTGYDRGRVLFTNRSAVIPDEDSLHVMSEATITAFDL